MLPFIATLGAFASTRYLFGRQYSEILLLPLALISYFFVSTEIFGFGTVMPFSMWNGLMRPEYVEAQFYVLLHFCCIVLVMWAADRIKKPAVIIKYTSLRGLRRLGWVPFFLCLSPAVLVVLAVGWDQLWDRMHFVPTFENRPLMRFADAAFWCATLLTPFLRKRAHRIIVLCAIVSFFAMLGSRSAPVMMIIFVVIERYMLGFNRPVRQTLLLLGAVYILAVLLATRYEGNGGMLALLQVAYHSNLGELIWFLQYGLNYLSNFSIVLNARMLQEQPIDAEVFFYGIVPLPSALYHLPAFYDAVSRFRVNIPFPGFGSAVGYLGITVYLASISMVYFGAALLRNFLSVARSRIDDVIFKSIIFIPFLISLQYNLRTSTRVLYVLLAIYFTVAAYRRFMGVQSGHRAYRIRQQPLL